MNLEVASALVMISVRYLVSGVVISLVRGCGLMPGVVGGINKR
jgi:hypothetical protein